MKRYPPGYQLSNLSETDDWFKEKNQLENQNTFYPRAISFEDIDKAVYEWFSNRDIIINEKNVPTFYLTPEKWAEFKHSWTYTDGNHNIKFPYITIRRSQAPRLAQDPQRGRIPNKTFTTYKIPYYDNGTVVWKLFKVPQPVKVDLEYEVRALTHYISDINIINETLLRHFASLQSYLDIQGHYMPMKIDNVSDESDFDNLEDERVIHTLYSIIVQGYIIDEKEFEEKLTNKNMVVSVKEDTT